MEIYPIFERWLNGSPLSDGETSIMILCIIMCILVIVNIALLIYACIIGVLIKTKEKKQSTTESP